MVCLGFSKNTLVLLLSRGYNIKMTREMASLSKTATARSIQKVGR